MRVLTVTNMFPTEEMPQFGIFVDEQVNSIRELGHDVDVLFVNPKAGILRHKAYLIGVPRLWQALRARQYDLIHAHYVFSGMIARAQRSTPLVLTHHGPELVDRWQRPICRWTRGWADETILVAGWMVPELGLEDVHVIPCGVNFSLFQPMDRREACQRLNLDPERRYILFAGNTWDDRKRFGLVEEAFRILSGDELDVELLVVCGKHHEEVPAYMNAGDVLAMASLSEGSAQVVKEAMACNLPIVATDAGDNWEVLGDTPGCFRTSADPRDIAARLRDAISPTKRTDGRQRVRRFGLDAVARSVVDVYEVCLQNAARGRSARQNSPGLSRPLSSVGGSGGTAGSTEPGL